MDKNEILRFVDPLLRFCIKRTSNRTDAEDLASDILLCVLEGMGKYEIASLDAWIWRIAHNRYARFINARSKQKEISSERDLFALDEEGMLIEEKDNCRDYQPVFEALHKLGETYRNVMIDHYIYDLSVADIAAKYQIGESAVKWRLSTGRAKIREQVEEREGDLTMERIYRKLNWDTETCNGCRDSKYLHSQIARAICEAAYEVPLTIEEISRATGIPALYIEDELPRLEYGEAVVKQGNKYAADFIILRKDDRKLLEQNFAPMISETSDVIERIFNENAAAAEAIGFYGCEGGMRKLAYILLPMLLRARIGYLKNERLGLANGPYPVRKDGGYGWFIVQENEDESGKMPDYDAGCNAYKTENGNIYCYWQNAWIDRLPFNGLRIFERSGRHVNPDGSIPEGVFSKEELADLISYGLVIKNDEGYTAAFPCFTKESFLKMKAIALAVNEKMDDTLAALILKIRRGFDEFVPKRLDSQINQWVSCFCHKLVAYVIEELVRRGVIDETDGIDGIFFVEGEYCVL
ncbi:MAG: RNA polymerase sigma factor [Clostridia bacterium]|nr:RNA polymerase sigma factor [Clostridia bacterium]